MNSKKKKKEGDGPWGRLTKAVRVGPDGLRERGRERGRKEEGGLGTKAVPHSRDFFFSLSAVLNQKAGPVCVALQGWLAGWSGPADGQS